MLSVVKMTKIKPQLAFLVLCFAGMLAPAALRAQSVFYLESTDNYSGNALEVEYRVLSVKTGKSYTIKNVEGVLFFELPELEDIKIKVTREGYYVEEKDFAANDLSDGETIKFQLEKRPTAKLVLTSTDGETGKNEPASFDVFFEGRMIGRGTTTRSQSFYELVVEQDGTYQVAVHAKSYDESRTNVPVQVSAPQNTVNQTIPLFKPAKEIGVRLVDEQRGNPVKADVEIKLTGSGEVLYSGTPANGLVLFTFENDKNYTITAGSEKFNRLEKKVEGSQREDIILRLRPNTYVEFKTVNRANQKPIAAQVTVKTPSGEPVSIENMSFVPKERGSYRVEVSAPGFVTKTGSFTVNTFAGGAMEVLYELDEADQQYHITVIDHYSKEQINDSQFRVFGPKGQQLSGVERNSKGEYVFVTDPSKEYFIEVSKPDYTDLTKMLNEKDKTITVELWWAPEVTYNLSVKEQHILQPVNNASVEITNSKSENIFVFNTGNGGLFKAKMPKNETYSYTVQANGFEPGIVGVNTKMGNVIELLVARAGQQQLRFDVIDKITGEPVDANLLYTLSNEKLPLKKVPQGRFQGDYAPGQAYEIEAIASNYRPFKQQLRPSLIKDNTLTLELQKELYTVSFVIENFKDNQDLRSVQLKLTNGQGSRITERFVATESKFEAYLQSDVAYKIQASKDGFEPYEAQFTLADLVSSNLVKSIKLTPLPVKESPPEQKEPEPVKEVVLESPTPVQKEQTYEKPAEKLPVNTTGMTAEFNKPSSLGKRYLLDEVYFDQSSAQIRDDEVNQLNELAATLKSNENVIVEIVGYTDNVGDPRLNLGLSQFRAKAVANYLFYKGADPSRIKSKGFGQDKPVADNDSEESRAKNRRVELVLIEN